MVAETVGEATWEHSLKSLKPGGTVVISGATSGYDPPAALNRVFFLQLSVVGSTMGTRDELERLVRLCVERDVRPVIAGEYPLASAHAGLRGAGRRGRVREARADRLGRLRRGGGADARHVGGGARAQRGELEDALLDQEADLGIVRVHG